MTVVAFPSREYVANQFESGPFVASGKLCGCVDFCDLVGWNNEDPTLRRTWTLTVPELDGLIAILTAARDDVVANSRLFTDPRMSALKTARLPWQIRCAWWTARIGATLWALGFIYIGILASVEFLSGGYEMPIWPLAVAWLCGLFVLCIGGIAVIWSAP